MKISSLLVPITMAASQDAYQIFFPPGHEAETVATAFLDVYPAEQYHTCMWFKCYESGQLFRIEAEDESGDVVDVSIDKNNVTLNNRKGTLITQSASQVKVDLVDYRWHQLCLNAASAKTQAYLDNKLLFEIDQDVITPIAGNYRKVVMGDHGFGGKIQDLSFGSSMEKTELSSKTYCGTQYKAISSEMNKIEFYPEDLWITRPIHIRDHEVVCNDLLSVDCGIDSVFVSVSHTMLKAIGEQYPTERLGLSKTCSNQTLTDFTTFRISPPESCGAEAFSEMNENVVRNSIFSLASDGQVFTADFSCRYPIDVTVIDSISPDLSSRVETSNGDEHVEIGLVRYEAHDYKTLAKEPLVISGNSPIVHMAAVIPEASHRDRYVLVEKCWTAGDKILLDEFGCVASENSFVYANGAPDNSPRFSLRLPDWSVEFMCTVVYCENDCEVSCGGAAKKRYGRQADDLSTTQASPTSNEDQATTQSVFIPLETTPSMVLDEFEQALFESEKELLASKTRLTIKFGPFDWVDMVQTTEESVLATTEMVTQPSLDVEIENIETPQPETVTDTNELETTEAQIDEDNVDLVKEVEEMLEEVERKLEEELEEKSQGIPGWMPLYGIIGAGIVAFITGFAVVVKFTKCRGREQPKLLN